MAPKQETGVMDAVISLAKRRGFIFQGSEIYGGLAGTWDYGPLGVALKNNVKKLWWKRFVEDRDDMFGVDAAILMNQNVWKASGHVGGFSDPLVECKKCKRRQRVDSIIDPKTHEKILKDIESPEFFEQYKNEVDKDKLQHLKLKYGDHEISYELIKTLKENSNDFRNYVGHSTQVFLNQNVTCPVCNSKDWNTPNQFNMMFQTNVGAVQGDSSISYLRPETAQGMFVNFKNIIDSLHPKLPFGLAQIGKAFRNEIAPRDFLFRAREFEQMEIEYFVHPKDWQKTFEHFVGEVKAFTQDVGLNPYRVSELEVPDGERAHYSKRTIDFEFDWPFGRKELYGLAYRTDFDLKQHADASKADLSYYDEETKERFIPHCIEPSFGLDRTILAILCDAYREDDLGGETRAFMKFNPRVAPFKVAVFPLLRNKPLLVEKAHEIFKSLKKAIPGVIFDDNGNIGKRYRRQDEIGTPFCVTIDFDTIEKGEGVTVRDRDTGAQERVAEKDLSEYLLKKIG